MSSLGYPFESLPGAKLMPQGGLRMYCRHCGTVMYFASPDCTKGFIVRHGKCGK